MHMGCETSMLHYESHGCHPLGLATFKGLSHKALVGINDGNYVIKWIGRTSGLSTLLCVARDCCTRVGCCSLLFGSFSLTSLALLYLGWCRLYAICLRIGRASQRLKALTLLRIVAILLNVHTIIPDATASRDFRGERGGTISSGIRRWWGRNGQSRRGRLGRGGLQWRRSRSGGQRCRRLASGWGESLCSPTSTVMVLDLCSCVVGT